VQEASRDDASRQEPGANQGNTSTGGPAFQYEPLERFGEGLTTARPWNRAALAGVERLNGRVAMIGFLAALIGEAFTGRGIVGQLGLMLRWLLG
jgi:hypothetical protein